MTLLEQQLGQHRGKGVSSAMRRLGRLGLLILLILSALLCFSTLGAYYDLSCTDDTRGVKAEDWSLEQENSAWPPGLRCRWQAPSGDERFTRFVPGWQPIPWLALFGGVALACAIGLVATRPKSPTEKGAAQDR